MSEKRAKAMRRKQKEVIARAEELRSEGFQPAAAAAQAMVEVIGCSLDDATRFIEKVTK